ncbi:hypothetical protein JCM10450v2_003097 [Rhodotorula kratochvilovae]
MSAAAHPALARNFSTSSHRGPYNEERETAAQPASAVPLTSSALPPGGLSARHSVHSQRSSIGDESVFGTPPVGVIGKTRPREVIRVERDYTAGETCQFWSGWIWELEGRVSPTDYQNTLNEVNVVLASAHNPAKSFFDNCLAILTLYISPLLLTSHYEREMRQLHDLLARANRELYNPVGLNLLSPRKNAFLFACRDALSPLRD